MSCGSTLLIIFPNVRAPLSGPRLFVKATSRAATKLTVVDLYQQPEATEDEQIIAAPTLVKKLPPPFRQLIGDLSNTSRLLLALDIDLETE